MSSDPAEVANSFFQAYLAAPVVLLFYAGAYAWKRTKPQRAAEMDLDTGRRSWLTVEDVRGLHCFRYYEQVANFPFFCRCALGEPSVLPLPGTSAFTGCSSPTRRSLDARADSGNDLLVVPFRSMNSRLSCWGPFASELCAFNHPN
jgi:hypothetical protein